MSELQTQARAPSFFDLYSRGEASPDDIDDFVDRWHDAQDPGVRSLELYEYLGMTHEEYEIWLCDPLGLPDILDARRSGRALADVMADRYEALRATNRPADATILFSLGNWLKQHGRQ
jgi:hypothetical protein